MFTMSAKKHDGVNLFIFEHTSRRDFIKPLKFWAYFEPIQASGKSYQTNFTKSKYFVQSSFPLAYNFARIW